MSLRSTKNEVLLFIRGSALPSVVGIPNGTDHGWQGRATDENGFINPLFQVRCRYPVQCEKQYFGHVDYAVKERSMIHTIRPFRDAVARLTRSTSSEFARLDSTDHFSALFVPLRCKKKPMTPQRSEERRVPNSQQKQETTRFLSRAKVLWPLLPKLPLAVCSEPHSTTSKSTNLSDPTHDCQTPSLALRVSFAILKPLVAVLTLFVASGTLFADVRIKDITTMEGARGNH